MFKLRIRFIKVHMKNAREFNAKSGFNSKKGFNTHFMSMLDIWHEKMTWCLFSFILRLFNIKKLS
jgi:uncharacterized protein YfbU (UPF0304 family)